MTILLRTRDLTVEYPWSGRQSHRHQAVRALDGVSIHLQQGETLGVVGESGCGKSTLAKALTGLVRPTAGSIEWKTTSDDPRERLAVQMVFQDPLGSLDPRMTVAESVAEPLAGIRPPPGRDAAAQRVREMLQLVGLSPELGDRYPHELSGGQCQRVGIARAMVPRPVLLVADEAVSALDVSIQCQIINLFMRLQRDFGITLVFVSHNIAVTRHISDRLLVMYYGRVVEIGPAAEVCDRPVHPYTRALIAAVPEPHQRDRATSVPRATPRPLPPGSAGVPQGCSYAGRCPLAIDRCGREVPDLRMVAGGRLVACHLA